MQIDRLELEEMRQAVLAALTEDLGSGDATTLATVPVETWATANMRAREPLVFAGNALAQLTFQSLSTDVQVSLLTPDGSKVDAGETLMRITGPARCLLSAERVALNFVQRLSGVATLTAQFVGAVAGTNARILDTRKTTPGWRRFEKYAVHCGGGQNHRAGLYDLILIKDNHLVALSDEKPNPIAAAVHRARMSYPALKVEVEADTLEQVEQALAAGADIILLDNMSLEQMHAAAVICRGRAKTEASGNVKLHTVRSIAETGVDYISSGSLTHSARAVDIALDFEA